MWNNYILPTSIGQEGFTFSLQPQHPQEVQDA